MLTSSGPWGTGFAQRHANIGQPARVSQNEVKDDYCFGDSRVTPDSTFVLDVTNSEDSYQRVLCQRSCDCSNSEDRSVGRQVGGQGAYSVGASSGSDCRADTIKAEPSTHVSDKQDGSRHCKHNTIKELNSMKPTNATHKLLWKEQYEYSASKLCKLSTHTHKELYKCGHRCLKRRMRYRTSKKPYKCERCEFSTSRLSHLQTHIRIHTGEKPYRCEHCNYSSSEIGNLKRHMRTHTGEKPYRCEHCNYNSSEISNLKTHMRTHTGEKPYRCEHCNYSSSQKGTLKRHMRTHTGEKPYRCEQCEYSTSEIGTLKKHMRTHTGEKPYKCEHCEYSASKIGTLKRHIRTHTGEKPYKCGQCEYSASQQGLLKIHMRTHTCEKPISADSVSTVHLNKVF
ncbi:Zinc finger protein 782 [Eumeta japonica]|uniref:Zinc finger protein 782 n=1 Tax=Eumeta variegata TaxID=151549 RepID=A0A4C1YWV2_EUMVA|nr:Zinc finger protein 782 [Eumeta japonica]